MAEAGIVLAGGASTRMGEDKAGLVFENATLLDRAIKLLSDFGADPVVVSGNRSDCEAVPDIEPGQGPLGGLYSVLSARPELAGHWRIIIPVDMPMLDLATLNRLANSARRQDRGAVFDRGPLPMVLPPGPAPMKTAGQILTGDGRKSLHRLAGQLGLMQVPSDPADRLDNINRPEEYRRLRDGRFTP